MLSTQISGWDPLLFLKGNLRYKTITSQNLSSEGQVKKNFISWKSYASFSRYKLLYF